jgi:5-methylcytosine-specific restriction protein A
MARRALSVCNVSGCPELCESGRCDEHRRAADRARGTFRQRGYRAGWDRRRRAFIARNPLCALCGMPSTVADHYPVSRRDLVDQGVTDPDASEHLRPLCGPCHSSETALHQPGGWNAR